MKSGKLALILALAATVAKEVNAQHPKLNIDETLGRKIKGIELQLTPPQYRVGAIAELDDGTFSVQAEKGESEGVGFYYFTGNSGV